MRVLVLGAGGKTGREVVTKLLETGHQPVAFVHHPQNYVAPEGVTVVSGDASRDADIKQAVAGCDAVISALGHTSTKASTALTDAARSLIAALPAGTKVITLTGNGVPDPADPPVPLTGKLLTTFIKLVPGGLFEDGAQQLALLRASSLNYTIVRAPRLTSGPATGRSELGYFAQGLADAVSRRDVAAAMIDALTNDRWSRTCPMIRTT